MFVWWEDDELRERKWDWLKRMCEVETQKKKIGKKKKTLWHGNDVAQLERNNNKYYTSAFRYIYIYI